MMTASCLCGDVRFERHRALDGIIACHCTQCRKQTGHHWASTHTADADLHFVAQESLRWYRSSAGARRGFCGSTLFWKADGSATTSVCAGAIDGPTGLPLAGQIFVADAGDYYEVAGGGYRKDHA